MSHLGIRGRPGFLMMLVAFLLLVSSCGDSGNTVDAAGGRSSAPRDTNPPRPTSRSVVQDGQVRVPGSSYLPLPDGLALIYETEHTLNGAGDERVLTYLLVRIEGDRTTTGEVDAAARLTEHLASRGYAMRDGTAGSAFPTAEGLGRDGTVQVGTLQAYLDERAPVVAEGLVPRELQEKAGANPAGFLVMVFEP